jgi:TolB-like protein
MADPAGLNATAPQVGADAVRAELELIAASTVFRRAVRLRTLLQYLVTEALREPDLALKEYHIGIEIFGKPDSFDPRADPIVRVEAGRLRLKLKSYYAIEGASDPVEIAVPVGSYAPVFRLRAVADPARAVSIVQPPNARAVAILPFKAMVNSRDELLASALAKQTAHAVSTTRNVRVLAWHSVLSLSNRKAQPIAAAGDSEPGAVLDGSVWRRRNTLSASVELLHVPDGRLLWSHIYERAGNIDFDLLRELAESIAADLVLPAEFGAAEASRRFVAASR